MNRFSMIAITAFAMAATLTTQCAYALEEDKKLSAEVEVGIISTGGNTETESYKTKVSVKQDLTNWRNHYILSGLFKSDTVEDETGEKQETTTAEKYFASAQADYKLNKEHSALFLYGEYDRNRFSGFDYQYTLAIGYSDRVFTRDNAYLGYSVGPGVTVDQPEGSDLEADPDQEENFIVRFSAEYVYQFSENAEFSQMISSNYATKSEQNSKTKSVTSVTASINGSLSLRASYTIDYNSEVPEDREHADTETAVTVVYSF